MSALKTQVGGDHYKTMAIQPLEYCHANGIGKIEGDVIAYVSRWRSKGGIEDLKKARHELDILIELERAKVPAPLLEPVHDACTDHDWMPHPDLPRVRKCATCGVCAQK